MEWILIGIMIAFGFYLAPVVLTLVITICAFILVVISELFNYIFRR